MTEPYDELEPDDTDIDYPHDGEPEPEAIDEALVGPLPVDDDEEGDDA